MIKMEAHAPAETQSDTEVIKKMEDEHLRLQRQVRMIQADRLHRAMGVHPQFRRQDNLLRTLKKEYFNLMMDLKIARSGAHKKKDKKMKINLKNFLLQREQAEVDCDGGKAVTDELEELLQSNTKEMMRLRQLATANQGKIEARRFQSESRLVSAENKLETAMLRFNAVQYENKQIREEIEHMLKDRAIFNRAWDKMLSALGKGKKFLSDLFESSTLAYDQRDEWVSKLRSIQVKGKMDQMLQVQEMQELRKAYDHEMKMYLFLAKKGIMRINPKQQEREKEQKRIEEKEIKKEYDVHVAILDEINDYTQEPNYNRIIEEFTKTEQGNFSMYKLVADRCAENEVLSRDLKKIRQDTEDRRDWNEMKEVRRQNKLEGLKQQLEAQKRRTSELRRNEEQNDQLLKDTMEQIQDIFKMLDCSLEPFQNLLGDKQPSLHQLDLTLCLITEKIKEHVENVYYYERVLRRSDKSSTSRLKKFTVRSEPPSIFTPAAVTDIVAASPCPSCIEARWMSRVSDSPETPFGREQTLSALSTLAADPGYVRSDRVHPLADCRAAASRRLLSTRHHY